uniref:Uncharacterized protein n=1 Tax=Vibrio crassostreae TaxID=246167 RepID=A0A0H3ZXM7_9VIBR|nr:hypothetical protein [Vibrio crassostreae]
MENYDRLKGSLRSIAFGINLFPRCEKTSFGELAFRSTYTNFHPR